MKALVFGRDGQLGWELVRQLRRAGREVVALDRDGCDVLVAEAVEEAIEAAGADVVYNCTAYNAVDRAEEDVAGAVALNAVAVGRMAAAVQRGGGRFVTVSTDYVFGEGHSVPISETEPPAPLSAYGRSKREGEVLALDQCSKAFVVRTTGLYSHRRPNFVKTMLKHALAGNPLTVVEDQKMSPTWVRPLARVLTELPERAQPGVYHAVAHGGTSWLGFAGKIFEVFGVDANLKGIKAAEWGAAAVRPSYSVLDNAMLRGVGLDLFEPWDDALERFAGEYSLDELLE